MRDELQEESILQDSWIPAFEAVSRFVISRRRRREIQNDLILLDFPGFPFDASTLLSIDSELCRRVDFAQGGEPVEPRVSPHILGLARNDGFVELRHSLFPGYDVLEIELSKASDLNLRNSLDQRSLFIVIGELILPN